MLKLCNALITFRKTIFISCALCCVAITTFGIVPQVNDHQQLISKRTKLINTLEEQRSFSPIHKAIVSESAQIFPQGTPAVTQDQRPPADISELLSIIEQTATGAELELVNVTPYPDSFARTGATFKVGCEVRGDYTALQKFLINLGAMPTLQSIDEMTTGADPHGIHCSLQLRFAVNG